MPLAQPDRKEKLVEVYSQVYDEFSAWSANYNKGLLQSLATESPSLAPSGGLRHSQQRPLLESDPRLSFTIADYDSDSTLLASSNFSPLFINVPKHLVVKPYPRYESCSPANRSRTILPRVPQNSTPFIPYTDQPECDYESYLAKFKHFGWQTKSPIMEPDVLTIRHETVGRLLFEHEFDYEEIASLELLKSWRITDKEGLIDQISKRDLISWSGCRVINEDNDGMSQNLIHRLATGKRVLLDDLVLGSRIFCANLNCLSSACEVHRCRDIPNLDLSNVPKLKSHQLLLQEGEKCGDDCFRSMDEADLEGICLTSDLEVDNILQMLPDLLPCYLATICRRSCREIFAYRKSFFPDERIISMSLTSMQDNDSACRPTILRQGHDNRKRKYSEAQTIEFDNGITDKDGILTYDPRVLPCTHSGACDSTAVKCECFESRQYCQRECHCGPQCIIQRVGCSCKKQYTSCSTSSCPCKVNWTECDPELCINCGARAPTGHTITTVGCCNVGIQKGDVQPIEIKRGQWGAGAFARKDMPKRTFIAEYVGELHQTLLYNDFCNLYRGLNYTFDIDGSIIVDGARVGNETRYLNDDRTNTKLNCTAELYVVNGELRIGLFTSRSVRRGEELFLSYGSDYWPDVDADESEEIEDLDKMPTD